MMNYAPKFKIDTPKMLIIMGFILILSNRDNIGAGLIILGACGSGIKYFMMS